MSRKTKQNKKKSPRLRRHSVFTLLSNGRFCITDANRPRNSVWLTISSTSLARHELRKRGSKKRQATFRSCAHHNATSPKGTMFVISNSPERGEQPPPPPPRRHTAERKKKMHGRDLEMLQSPQHSHLVRSASRRVHLSPFLCPPLHFPHRRMEIEWEHRAAGRIRWRSAMRPRMKMRFQPPLSLKKNAWPFFTRRALFSLSSL